MNILRFLFGFITLLLGYSGNDFENRFDPYPRFSRKDSLQERERAGIVTSNRQQVTRETLLVTFHFIFSTFLSGDEEVRPGIY
jgi:hypothetical protein